MKIAILGATSHIAKGLTLTLRDKFSLDLYARNLPNLESFVRTNLKAETVRCFELSEFASNTCDVVVNCIGLGAPKALAAHFGGLFTLTEHFDNLIIQFLRSHPQTKYINMSSGAVYSGSSSQPFEFGSLASIAVNALAPANFYQIAKLNSEAKHRCLQDFAIVDVRVFGYFSRFIDLDAGFLLSDILASCKNKTTLHTGTEEIVRDYVGPSEMALLVSEIAKGSFHNCAVDIFSRKPCKKSEILDYFANQFGLKIEIDQKPRLGPSGAKPCYASRNFFASEVFGYSPKFDSLEIIKQEAEIILGN